jgi:molecular chaperone DnaK (HSP70)
LQRLICALFDPTLTSSFTVSDESIALIAAAEAASLMGDPSAREILHTAKHSLTLSITEPMGPLNEATQILQRGERLPMNASTEITWGNDGGDTMRIQLFKGDCQFAEYMPVVGEMNVSGFVPDADGITRTKATVALDENNHVNLSIAQEHTGRVEWKVFKVYSIWKYCVDEEEDETYNWCGEEREPGLCREIGRRYIRKFTYDTDV